MTIGTLRNLLIAFHLSTEFASCDRTKIFEKEKISTSCEGKNAGEKLEMARECIFSNETSLFSSIDNVHTPQQCVFPAEQKLHGFSEQIKL